MNGPADAVECQRRPPDFAGNNTVDAVAPEWLLLTDAWTLLA
jgi:hypothetical protein